MSLEEHKIIESLITITKERDKRSLEQALLKTLNEIIDCESILLLDLVPKSTNKELKLAYCIPSHSWQNHLTILPREFGENFIRMDELHENCAHLKFPISSNDSAKRKVFPIVAENNKVLKILDISGYQSDANSYQIILNFIRIFSNFLSILNDNEHDALTGLLNRKTFDSYYSQLINEKEPSYELSSDNERRKRDSHSDNWLAIIDIDHFKRINDTFGHIYGDEVLLLFADLLNQTFRSNDLLFRHGGEEFLIILAPLTEKNAELVLERFRSKLESVTFPQVGKVTASIGMVKLDKSTHPTEILGRADQALYYAKENGRNQLQNYHSLINLGLIKNKSFTDDIELF